MRRGALLRARLHELYRGESPAAARFQWWAAAGDILVVGFFVLGPILQDHPRFLWIDYAIALLLSADFAARALATNNLRAWLKEPVVWMDALVLATLLAPGWLVNLGFLRVLRLWTLSRKDMFWRSLDRRGYREWQDVARALVNLLTCLFLISGFIFVVFARADSGMEGYVDALYFTVATVTTTGFGDITLPGTAGKLTAIVTMIVGISLFVQLAQAVFKPYKIFFTCPNCALQRHEPDAVHCKACGEVLKIPDNGD